MFGTTFFVLTGLHGAHVTIGIIWLLSLWGRSMQGRLPTEKREAVEIAGLYWHFVDVVWIFIFTAIYLIPDALRTTRMTDSTDLVTLERRRARRPTRRGRRARTAGDAHVRSAPLEDHHPGAAPVRADRGRARDHHRASRSRPRTSTPVTPNLHHRRARS